jgi:Tol biopolymer transport system component
VNSDGTREVRLTYDPGSEADPSWSPSGEQIAYNFRPVGESTHVAIIHADGSDASHPRILTPDALEYNGWPNWSPDGSKLLFQSNRSGNWDIWGMDADGGNQVDLSMTEVYDEEYPAWSPDGTRIAYAKNFDNTRRDI